MGGISWDRVASDGVGVHVYFSDKSYGVAALQRLDDLAKVLAADKDANEEANEEQNK